MTKTTADGKIDDGITKPASHEAIDETPAVAADPTAMGRALTADNTIKNHVIAAISASIIPVPLVDVAAIMGIQLNMIRSLSQLYGKPFSQSLGKNIIVALAGGVFSYGVGFTLAASAFKIIPGVGWMIGFATLPVVAGATTFAIGRVFIKQYEEGGSMFDLNTSSVAAYYKQEFQKGRVLAEHEKTSAKAKKYAADTEHFGKAT